MALDPYYNNVSLLLPMEGANDSTAFVDYSPTPKTIARYGDAKISTAQSKWGQGSGYFDGSGDYLTCEVTPFQFGTADFTLEFWLNLLINNSVYPQIMASSLYDSGGGFYITCEGPSTGWGGTARLFFSSQALMANFISFYSTTLFRDTGWHHVAICREGLTHWLFVDGVQENSKTTAGITNYSGTLGAIFTASGYTSGTDKGYMQDLRITKGVARYTANFTPPPRLQSPEFYSSKYLYPGALPALQTLSGNCIVSGNGGAQQVVIRDVATRLLMGTATPASNGDWSAMVPPGAYDITYFAPNCQPICHGPYTVTA